ncbi:MAG: 16S rRNA (uracil(1498)-N(3))-methyltransferase, partial [Calothrix sp. SM1_7_51]|nr:16S rRNA (uracil(1498)-N(3))-methyltransferase [Calothrix sp. SM1_7_51]
MSQLQRITVALEQLQENQIFLTQEQKHYLLRVLRLQSGDKFIAMDGQGSGWVTQLAGQEANILESLELKTELPVAITLITALPKGNGFDDVVRACTEIGVTCIAPVTSDRTLLNPSSQKLERWQRIAKEAAEQSERAIVPTILSPVTFLSFLSSDLSLSAQSKFICEARGDYPH